MTHSYQNLSDPEKLSKENKVLAGVIASLPQGILVCNDKGELLLYNKSAITILRLEQDKTTLPDLGQMITSLIDKNLIEHTLDEINERLKQNAFDTASYFIFGVQQKTVQARVSPLLHSTGKFNGFVILLEDITQQNKVDQKIENTLHSLAKNARSPIASIRAAIESMIEYPKMDMDQQDTFKEIIHNESLVLSNILNDVSKNYSSLTGIKKSVIPISVTSLFDTIKRRAKKKISIHIETDKIESDILMKADRYTLIVVILFLLNQLKEKTGSLEFFGIVSLKDTIVNIDFHWKGNQLDIETLRQWENQYPDISGQIFPLTLKESINANHAALWPFKADTENGMPYLRLLIPGRRLESEKSIKPIMVLPETQFDIYDPNLFSKSMLDPELDNRLLTELSYTSLIREISQADTLDIIIGKHSQLPRLIHSMLTSGTKTKTITWLITTFSDAILEKVIEFASNEVGPPPVPFAFITLGSEGRQEQTLKTDQDNAIIYEDIGSDSDLNDDVVKNYFLELGEKICTWLDQAGYDFCLGGIMAKNTQWCESLSIWKGYFTKWIQTAKPENLLHTSVFFDFRFAYGDNSLADRLRQHLFQELENRPIFLRFMSQNSLNFRPPIGFWGNFLVESNGLHKKSLDIKICMAPIVDFARIYSLKHSINETNTQNRLYQLYVKRVFNRGDYNEIEQAYSFLLQIRFMRQINTIIGEKIKPDNYINPKGLSKIEQKMLKEVLKKVKLLQLRLTKEFIGE